MKYCPYCGAELFEETASFCTECGSAISSGKTTEYVAGKPPSEKKPGKRKKTNKKKSKADFEKRKAELLSPDESPGQDAEQDDYDGYYSDIIPSDLDREKEELDRDLIKKIAVIAGAMLLIVGLCVVAMYFL